MNPWLKWGLTVLAVVLVIVGGAYYWFFLQSGTPTTTFALDIKEIRRLADSQPGGKPVDIRVEHVAPFSFAGNIVLAGDGWSQVPLEVFAYKVQWPLTNAIIDTGLSPRGAIQMGVTLDEASYRRVVAALKSAGLIVVTHEHADHVGGLLSSPWLELELARTKLTKEQVGDMENFNPSYRHEGFVKYKPIDYQHYLAVGPGMVLIKAPGHTPGSQMVYLKLANGQEYLFTGDVAWTMRNIDTMRERARATTISINEDREAVLAQLAALNALKKAAPQLHIVPGHDPEVVKQLEASGLLKKDFSDSGVTYVY